MPRSKLRLKTRRLLLRTLKECDAEAIKENITEEVKKWLPEIPWPYTLDHAREYICNSISHLERGTAYNFGIVFENKLIGTISLYNIDKKEKKARLGYLLNKNYWGMGIMREAVEKVIEFGFMELNLEEIYTGVILENKPSYNLLKKIGFREKKTNFQRFLIEGKYHDEVILSLSKNIKNES